MTRNTPRAPRVAVTLSPESLRILDELSELRSQPKSAIVAELVDMALPALKIAVDALRQFQESPREAQRLLQNFANERVTNLAQASLDLDAAIDGRTVKGKRLKRGQSDGAT